MKYLIIIRHGDAARDDVTLTDAQRPLTSLGRRQAVTAATEFLAHGLQMDTVVSSPARRALDTANIWTETLKIPGERLQINQDVYEAERIDLLRIVQQLDDADDTVALIGHNPGVTGLLHHLVGRGVETMETSSYAVIAINVDQWSRIALRSSELMHYHTSPTNEQYSLWQRFDFWRKQRIHKMELFAAFLIGLIIILGVVIAVFSL